MNRLDEIRKIAAERGGKCLATEYSGNKSKLRFRCNVGHDFDMCPSHVKNRGQWCPYCSGRRIDNPLLELQQIATAKGGECLSNSYEGSKAKMPFRCEKGHEWIAIPHNIKNGTWCPYCSNRKLINPLDDMRKLAADKGGECLATEYLGNKSKLKFICKHKHEWEARRGDIKNDHWCPYCAGQKLINPLDDMRKIAADKGGECLATEYINTATKYEFRCKQSHQFTLSHNHVTRLSKGVWCPECKNTATSERQFNLRGLEDAKKIALKNGGECLSVEYKGAGLTLRFRCSHDHEWETSLSLIKGSGGKKGTWCPVCCGNVQINPLGKMQNVAKERGGECLATNYINSTTKIHFRCADNHEFETSSNRILAGQWCPSCVNKTEALVRQFFKCVFDASFPSKAPDWLQHPGMPRRVLDGINEPLKLAFEYHGIQHFQHVKHFHDHGEKTKKPKTLAMQIERDALVRDTCFKHGVTLVEIMPLPDGYTKDKFIVHVSEAIKNSVGIKPTEAAIAAFSAMPFRISKLKEIKEIAQSKGGDCLSSTYISINSKLKFVCAVGHEWEAIPKTIKNGNWCQACAGFKIINPLERMQKFATDKGGQCLAIVYVNCKTKLKFRCKVGHEWDARPNGIQQGTWCPVCAGKKPKESPANNA